MRRLLGIVFLAALAFCATSAPAAADDGEPVEIVATLSGHDSAASYLSLCVANTDEEWSRAMAACFPAEHRAVEYLTYDVNGHEVRGRGAQQEIFAAMRPPHDLGDYTAVFLCAGKRNAGEFAVAVRSVTKKADAVEVRYDVVQAELVRKEPAGLSAFTIVFIPKTILPIRFMSGEKALATVDGAALCNVINGLQIALDVKPTTWKIGATVELGCTMRKITDAPLRVMRWGLGSGGALDVVDGGGALLRPEFARKASRELADADCPFLNAGEKRFTLTGRIQRDGTLSVGEPLGGQWSWGLAIDSYGVTATCVVEDKDWTLPMEQMECRWTGSARSNTVKVTVEGAPTKVDLAPLPGAAVNGLKLALKADRALLKMSARELLRASADTPRWNVEPVALTFEFTNVSDKPIKLDAYDLIWSRLTFDVKGPDAESVRVIKRMVEREMLAPEAKHYPTIARGRSWASVDAASFPGILGENEYVLLKPGEYRIKATYRAPVEVDRTTALAAGSWGGEVVSNELVLTAVEPGAAVNGLKLTLAADKTELKMTPLNLRRATRDQPHYRIEPVALTATFANVSDKPIKIDAYDLVWSRLTLQVTGPAEYSVVVTQRLVDRTMRLPEADDYHVVEPGQSWTSEQAIAFPGDFGASTWVLNAPGEYRVAVSYSVPELREGSNPVTALTAGIWRGLVVSNELVLKGVVPEAGND